MSNEHLCAHCGGSKDMRNPSGHCDHLYWPDYLTDEAKRANGYVPVQYMAWTKAALEALDGTEDDDSIVKTIIEVNPENDALSDLMRRKPAWDTE